MGRDVVINKTENIERCIQRIHQEYQGNPANLENFTKQDSIILNLQRACEAAIDIAIHLVSVHHLGVPQNSRGAFDILYEHDYITRELNKNLKAMIGFRNIAIHDYQAMNLSIVQQIIEKHLPELRSFAKRALVHVDQ